MHISKIIPDEKTFLFVTTFTHQAYMLVKMLQTVPESAGNTTMHCLLRTSNGCKSVEISDLLSWARVSLVSQ